MVHTFQCLGVNVAVDVNSGAVHVLDELTYHLLELVEPPMGEHCPAEVAARLEAEGLRPDVITVDPPRKGLAPEVIGTIAAMGPERVVYVSCDPATLGRDVKRFAELGYRAVRACAVDMFPGTRHVESVVRLERHNMMGGT